MSHLLEDDHYCYVCGKNNPNGLKLDFSLSPEGRLKAEVVFSKEHQGFKGLVHGGMLAAVLDDVMVNLTWGKKIPTITAELVVRLKKPTPINQKISLEGWVEKVNSRVVYTSATAKDKSGHILASATATCMRVKPSFSFDKT